MTAVARVLTRSRLLLVSMLAAAVAVSAMAIGCETSEWFIGTWSDANAVWEIRIWKNGQEWKASINDSGEIELVERNNTLVSKNGVVELSREGDSLRLVQFFRTSPREGEAPVYLERE